MDETELLSEIAKLYYEQNLTQKEIANRLYLSRSSISRLLKQARDEAIVEIIIKNPYDRMRNLEYEFFKRFSINEIRILDTGDDSDPSDFKAVTKLAALHLNSRLNNDSVLGITWGKTLYGMVGALRSSRSLPNMRVVQLAGSIGFSNPIIDGPDLVKSIADIYGCKYHTLIAPFKVNDAMVRKSLMNHPSILETFALIQDVNIICTSIGGSDSFWKLEQDEREFFEGKGAVGNISGYYFDINGKIIDSENFYDQIICADRKFYSDVPFRIGIVADDKKAYATLGALRGGLINSLVISSYTAKKVIELDEVNS